MRTCRGCDDHRRRYLVGGTSYDCKKSGKLCEVADLRLAQIHQHENGGAPLTIERHRHLMLVVQEGQQGALRRVNSHEVGLPRGFDAFQRTIRELHSQVFKGTGLRFAGTFRQPGEPDVFFGSGANERMGASAADVLARLNELHLAVLKDFGNRELDASALARICGRFLEEFFEVHPFHDGNGRVARLFLRVMALSTGRYYFDVLPEDGKSRRKYEEALEFAHRHCRFNPGATWDGVRAQDPYRLITVWLRAHLREQMFLEMGSLEEEAPAWLEERYLAEPPGWDEPHVLEDRNPYDKDDP